MKWDVICIGSATQDLFIKSNTSKILKMSSLLDDKEFLVFDYGSKINVDNVYFATGGGSTNVAASMAKQGLKSACFISVGKDPAAQTIKTELEQYGISTELIFENQAVKTGFSVILNSFKGDRTVLTYRGANNFLEKSYFSSDKLKNTDWIYLSSLNGKSVSILQELVQFLKNNSHIKLAWNPGSTQLKNGLNGLKDLLELTSILFLNREEAEMLSQTVATKNYIDEKKCNLCQKCVETCPQGIFKLDENKIITTEIDKCVKCGRCLEVCDKNAILIEPWSYNLFPIFEKIRKYTKATIVITDGSRGVQVYDKDNFYLKPSYQVNAVDTLGAGDSFASTVVTCQIKGYSWEKTLSFASANAASVVSYYGAKRGLLTEKELEKKVEKLEKEEFHLRTIPKRRNK
jgi:sugar/nucleoside kinase (ribokinase family)